MHGVKRGWFAPTLRSCGPGGGRACVEDKVLASQAADLRLPYLPITEGKKVHAERTDALMRSAGIADLYELARTGDEPAGAINSTAANPTS